MRSVLFIFPLVLSACVINADFDRYDGTPTDETLIGSIPGPPGGDLIVEPTNNVFVVDGTALGGKALRVNEVATFRAANHATPDRYIVTWRGQRLSQSGGPIRVRVMDSNNRVAVGLLVSNFEYSFLTGEASDAPLTESMSAGVVHDVRLEIEGGVANNISVSLTEVGSDETTSHVSLDPVNSDFEKVDHILVQAEDGAAYTIDDLLVETEN